MRAARGKSDPRARHEVLDRAGNEDLAGLTQVGDPRPHVYRNAGDVVALHVALARVHAGANLEPERSDCRHHRERAANRASRTIEACQEPIPGRADLPPSVAFELAPYDRMMPAQEIAPGAVAQRRSSWSRGRDVGEKDRRKHPVDLRSAMPCAGQE